MPESAPRIKVDGVRRHGGEVVFAGAVRSLEQGQRAEAIAREDGLAMVPPFDHPDVIAGQGTCGLEIPEQRPDVAVVLVAGGRWRADRRDCGGGLRAQAVRRASSRWSRPGRPS